MFLGIDIGTSAVKVIIIDEQEKVCATSQAHLTIAHRQPLWAEQQPEDWWQALNQAMQSLMTHHKDLLAQVLSIGLSGQMHGAVCLNKQQQVIRPAILWNDGRSFNECEDLLTREPQAHTITGNLIMPGFTAPKIMWLKKHEPDNYEKITHVLLPKDYIRWRLSGDFASDLSDASGTCWLNVAKRCYSDSMIAASDTKREWLPELYEGCDITGTINPDIAKRWHLASNVKIVAGGGDNAASAISMNITNNGQGFLSLGTSGVLFVADNHYHSNPNQGLHSMCHCLPQKWHHMSVHLNVTGCLTWLCELLDINDYQTMTHLAKTAKPNNLIFLPYLSGERTPFNNPHAKGVFFGLDNRCGKAELIAAGMQGIAMAIALGQESIKDAGITIDSLYLLGGGSQNEYWRQIFANVLQQPLHLCHDSATGAALGAAKLARFAMSGGDIDQAFKQPVISESVTPASNHSYHEKLDLFKQLYQQLSPLLGDTDHD